MVARPLALACLVLACLALTVPADARLLLHKKHHKHDALHHGHCKTIARVLRETPSLSRFAKAFDEAQVPFISGLVDDPHARATFLAVQDENLGTGDTVFDEAPIRFQQHTILDRVKTCKAKDGDAYTTLAGTKLTVVKDTPKQNGRKLQQVSEAWTALLDQVLPMEAVMGDDSEAVPESERPVSNIAIALPEDPRPDGRPRPRPRPDPKDEHPHPHPHPHPHAPHDQHHPHPEDLRHPPHDGPHNDDDDHEGPHGKHAHGKGHGKHCHHKSAKDMVAHAIAKAEAKAMAHGAVYLQSNVTSQRVRVLGSVHACEGTVLLVSAFLNAPPTPDPVVLLAAQQPYIPHKATHEGHEGGHRHHHHHPGHHHPHGYLECLKHAFRVWAHRIERLFHGHPPPHHHKGPCKHGKHHVKHAKIEKHEAPNDPELLAYYAAHERTAMGNIDQAAKAAAVNPADAGNVNTPKKEGRVTVYKLPAAKVQQRPVDPRAIVMEELNHMPLVLPSAADEAVREVRSWLDGLLW